jgi:hypothetical protein
MGFVRAVQRAVGARETGSASSIPGADKNNSLIDSLPTYEKDIMEAIRKHPNIPFTLAQLAIKSGKSDRSSSYASAVHKLIKLHLIQKSGADLTYIP